jgi:LemA protein
MMMGIELLLGMGAVTMLGIGFFLWSSQNILVGKKNQVEQVNASIDVILKKRFDLIPSLVETVKQYMQHEQGVLERITALRSKALATPVGEEKFALANEAKALMGSAINIAMEAYPELQASTQFTHLQGSIAEVEEQLSAARRAYNSAVTDYNNSLEMFPTSMVATSMNYKRQAVFEAAAEERIVPNVKQLFQ